MSAGPTTSSVPAYIADGPEIYRRSFAIIRAEADLAHLPDDAHDVVIRMIHSCGMVDLAGDTEVSPGAIAAAQRALRAGAPVLCDAEMVASGITRRFLPAGNDVVCTLNEPRVPDLAAAQGTTRSAAALELWREHLDGAVVAIGNAPTALFRLLEMIEQGAPRPAVVLGLPVGFVGAMESKAALVGHPSRLEHVVVHGRRGGSALTVGAVNALALGTTG
ncbi:precorrin-8X methylmutase [Actinomycetospora sp. NBRC 106375]|uniref:precorrin-8X methylmutase n=1 Tax=Actinomycetospora sp. NBRC 106375 TaxID=3032207 RepID=UPI0024A5254B|nr:precorrin-8X methylmutase [Actinomycetospora sp. NBRC 106375]GLZ49382.1 precorrin-8X methylmutase [Actinomycetospora sp. NBRC 106375]